MCWSYDAFDFNFNKQTNKTMFFLIKRHDDTWFLAGDTHTNESLRRPVPASAHQICNTMLSDHRTTEMVVHCLGAFFQSRYFFVFGRLVGVLVGDLNIV